MEPYLGEAYGNPSSIHKLGQRSKMALDDARDSVAAALGATASEIVFTSGGTESDNAAIAGVAWAASTRGKHIVTTAIEHEAVLDICTHLRDRFGFEVTFVAPGSDGVVQASDIKQAIRDDTVLVSVMYANNEVGTIQPVGEIGELCRISGVPFHVDAVQAAGSIPIDVKNESIDLLSISAHKFYGPKGVGALYIRQGNPWWPSQLGGGQERERRSGTENVPGIVGMAEALSISRESMATTNERVLKLRDRFLELVLREIPEAELNGCRDRRLPGNANLRLPGVDGESMVTALDALGIMVSAGSACSSGSTEPSHVLLAMGQSVEDARSAVRFTLGKENTMEEIDLAAHGLIEVYRRLSGSQPHHSRPPTVLAAGSLAGRSV